jgi:hypothetical protein
MASGDKDLRRWELEDAEWELLIQIKGLLYVRKFMLIIIFFL